MNEGNNIQRIRKEKGLTQAQLSQKAGISEISIRKYESGDRKPKLETVRKIAHALNVYINEIIDDWSDFSQEEIIKDMAAEANDCFWLSHLEDKLNQIGCSLKLDEDNCQMWIKFPDGLQEVTETQLKKIDNSTVDYLNFKLNELRAKHPDDFRSTSTNVKWQSLKERLNDKDSGLSRQK